ncbi:3-hydroxyanthranilate 3,4-dioxygenase [Luteibaculum oceani]|uniref:3-hydroxyanthranilate 3,4-dioxygenase n=1 Tax=Luteibaculum oceani TaxID=1294296 RepID=A0A5C6VKY9_9FLAO|nr:3-hydroxyanthranilate 3,4-dioxygenase [Luteibaculum oceani]TXC85434.1 3-hydroxyanthranilate 3,4-dioxygenase [Luteibaculum oceani]
MNKVLLKQWIQDHQLDLKPPVGNKVIVDNEDMLVMAVGGPNARLDYHYNETPEFFYQIKGDLHLHLQVNGVHKEVILGDEELFLLDARVPHLPQRSAGSIGLVIELKRNENQKDGLLWFCPKCNSKVYEEYFGLKDIEKDFHAVFNKFYNSEALRTCKNCGAVHPKP